MGKQIKKRSRPKNFKKKYIENKSYPFPISTEMILKATKPKLILIRMVQK